MNILVLGATGLIGRAIKKILDQEQDYNVIGTFNNNKFIDNKRLINFNVFNDRDLDTFIKKLNPDFIINCIGITKHLSLKYNDNEYMEVNANFPKKLSLIAFKNNSKFIQISTDCIYSGKKGNYKENDVSDANDIYGISKSIGEKIHPSSLILRTSTVGREIGTKYGLIEWFLSQDKECEGYQGAIFSGITNIELGKILKKYIISKEDCSGTFNISSSPINKYEFLKKLALFYKKDIKIYKNNVIKIDRSLSNSLFKNKFGYVPKSWDLMLSEMDN